MLKGFGRQLLPYPPARTRSRTRLVLPLMAPNPTPLPGEDAWRGYDVEPLDGRLVLFWSDPRVPHEVMRTEGKDRFAISVWYGDPATARIPRKD